MKEYCVQVFLEDGTHERVCLCSSDYSTAIKDASSNYKIRRVNKLIAETTVASKSISKGVYVKFHSGNFKGCVGQIIETDFNSTSPSAIFGYLHTVRLTDGREVYIEKSEHYTIL